VPGENLQKLNKSELAQLRGIVRKVYCEEQGMSAEEAKVSWPDRECDKLIDSLLPDTVEKLKEMGESRGFLSHKKFFLPSKIVGLNGKRIMKEDV
jgi:hypothetical protein